MGKRQDARDRIERQIIELGRRHLASDGAAALSLRAIARDLGMASSAVYRYVADRDDLLTLLLVDAYTELADTVDAARADAEGHWRAELTAVARAARGWALEQPAGWALLYGSPVPGYHAPRNRTVEPGTRVVGTLFSILSHGVAAGDITGPEPVVPQSVSRDFDGLRDEFSFTAGDAAVARCLTLWAALVGAISLEVFGQYGSDTFGDTDAVFDVHLAVMIQMMGASPGSNRPPN